MKTNEQFEHSIRTKKELLAWISQGGSLKNCTISPMDLQNVELNWEKIEIENTTFLGCEISEAVLRQLQLKGAAVYTRQPGLVYNPFRSDLYTWQELEEAGTDTEKSVDMQIYEHFSQSRWNPHINEALNQRIHDHAMDDALRELLEFDEQGMTKKKCVGIMGGHSTLRTDLYFKKTAFVAQLLTQSGFLVVSGGGPGIMEAANLGAYFAAYEPADLADALDRLAAAPSYQSAGYQDCAKSVLEKYPNGSESLAIPTWFYGHEPSNLFASGIAKYFSNSLREDVLLAICLYGIVFSPGSAGTTQEIFQDAAQNHYATFGYYSPMVFLGVERYEIQTMLYPLLRQLAWGKRYRDLLLLSDDPQEIVQFLLDHPPVKK